MCPRLSEHWRTDGNRRRRIRIFGPFAWSVALLMSVAGGGLVFASFLVLAFRWGGAGAWPIIGIMLASIGFVVAVTASVDWLTRRRRRRRERTRTYRPR